MARVDARSARVDARLSRIAPEHLDRIFEPYFTTKDAGHGLGLAIVHSIVKKHDGAVRVRSSPGSGTTFEVDLPACESLEAAGPERASPPMASCVGRQARILVLDDQPGVGSVIATMVAELGLRCCVVASVDEAVAAYVEAHERGRRSTPSSSISCCLVLPGDRGGKECLAELRGIHPEVRAIVASGYSTDPVLAEPARHGFVAVLAKPFTRDELEQALVRALAGGGVSTQIPRGHVESAG